MNTEVMLRIISAALEIGRSSKHYVTISASTNKLGFPVTVYIHNTDYKGISDSMAFSTDSSYELHREWLTGWKAIIETERDEDEAN